MSDRYIFLKIGITFLLIHFVIQSVSSQLKTNQELILIAHRGGIVDSLHPENSLASIREAFRRGFRMIEVDIRETADGRAILQHDPDFNRYYNCPALVSDLTWNEVKLLQSQIDGSRPILFEEAVKEISGKMSLMLDIKGNNFSDSFYTDVGDALRKYGLLESTFILGGNQAKLFFPETSHSIEYNSLIKAAEKGEEVSKRYHLFMLASQLDTEKVQKAFDLGVIVVAAVNEFRYRIAGQDVFEYAKRDIDRLLALGVKYYQIDSIYAPYFYD